MKRLTLLATLALAAPSLAQPFDPSLLGEMRWRMIGPFRGGRTVAASGVPGKPNLFYVAANNGGVWKSDDYGRVFTPIFDDQPTGSIGALAVAPSRPDVIYVGSGEGLQRPDLSTGDGMFRSTDAGATWKHLGLRDAQQIASIVVDPKDPERAYVAVLGHPYGPNEERGVFRTVDGGATWQKVLYRDADTGAVALALDPKEPRTVYAVLWQARLGPWENGVFSGPGSSLQKSTDGGTTWRAIGKGLPTFAEGLGRIGVGIAPSDAKRVYALVEATSSGLFRSDDAGETFVRVNSDARVSGRGSDFAELKVDPRNRDVVWVANVAAYRSTDAGVTFTCVKGAPGGDDYHTIWINPENPDILLFAADQGATISVNGGRTWSSWYNQPTAQLYHVTTDDRFPYWVYGGQQESGSVAIASRGDHGAITSRDWYPVGVEEYGYVAVDPLDQDLVYGGKLTRFDRRSFRVQDVSPEPVRTGKYRFLRTAPVVFSPADPRQLFYAGNVLFRTTSGGKSWDVVSPDLSRERPEIPANVGVYRTKELESMKRRGVIYTVAPSPKDANVIWAGTDDGLIHVTKDGGKTWTDVTPPSVTAWSKVSLIDASRFDAGTAYAAINRFRLDDLAPLVLSTHDSGKTWTAITNGLPKDAAVNVVREDPERKGLLYAGTEKAVHVSFDDGAHWQPLRLNMPAISIRDLVIHGDDVVAGTHGRGFWILDDVTPLRQLTPSVAASGAHLFTPQTTFRMRRNLHTDTPPPPEEPAGQNPPDGAILDYWLGTAPKSPVTLEVLDASGALVRRFASDEKPEVVDPKELALPPFWVRPPRTLPATPGMHRFVWDLRLPSPPAFEREMPISAIPFDTPREPLGPLVPPGAYTVRLTVDGVAASRPLVVKMDPRERASQADLETQHRLAVRIAAAMKATYEARQRKGNEAKAADLEKWNGRLAQLLGVVDGADAAPTTQAVALVEEFEKAVAGLVGN